MSGRLLLVLGSSAGGVARHVGQIAALFGDAGWDVRVAGPAGVREQVAPAVLDVVDIADRPRPAADARAVRRLRHLVSGADAVHAHGLRAGALAVLASRGLRAASGVGGRASRRGSRRSPRVVVTLHNRTVGGRAVRAVSQVLERVVVRGADVVLAVSPDLADRARRLGARRVELALVPATATDPVDPAAVRATRSGLALGPGELLVVTVGRLAPQKGTRVLADAAALLAQVVPATPASTAPAQPVPPGPWRWAVAGDGPLRSELVARLRESGAPVELLGVRDDVPALLAAADVVVSTAVWEGQPLWLQEALAQHAAIVATDAGGTRAVVGGAGVLVPVGDAVSVAREVARLLSDASAREELRGRAARRADELPTSSDVREQLQDVYASPPG
jgi:glycosyltransferase involved in cell wall biosynthesis